MNTKTNNYLGLIIWMMLAIFYFYQFIGRSSFITVLNTEFMMHFDTNAAGIGLLGGCYYLIYTLMQIPAGIIVDRYSLRKVAVIATLTCTAGLYLLVATSNLYCACFAEMLLGFGSSFAFVQAVKAITAWFPSNRVAIMTSYTMSIGCLGPVIGGPGVAYIVRYFQWQEVIKNYSLFGLVLAAILWIVIKDKNNQLEEKHEEINVLSSLKSIVSSGQAWILALFTMALYAPLSALGDLWGVSFIKVAYGLNAEMAAVANNMLYLGVVIGSPLIAYFVGVINSYKKPMVAGISLACIFLSIIVYGSSYVSTSALFVLFFLTGFACGAMLTYPLAIMLFPKNMGATVTGFVNMMSMVSGIILMPTIGVIINYFWNGLVENGIEVYQLSDYRYGLSAVVIFLIFGVIVSLFIKDSSPNAQK